MKRNKIKMLDEFEAIGVLSSIALQVFEEVDEDYAQYLSGVVMGLAIAMGLQETLVVEYESNTALFVNDLLDIAREIKAERE
jgi:hypothetical protein